MSGVFINYRDVDNPLGAAHVAEILIRRFGEENVFLDHLSMRPGEKYPDELRAALERADVLVCVIGPRWLTLTEEGTGVRLIEREQDWVRMEIARAVQRGIPILPVLLKDTPEDAKPPLVEELPEDIKPLAHVQAFDLSRRRLAQDVERLTTRLIQLIPTLVIPRLFVRQPPALDPDNAPSTLLRADYAEVPFAGRDRQLADLLAWATSSTASSVKLVVGPAGSGKTRLAMELCARLVKQGWLAGIVSGEAPAVQIGHTTAIDKPLLVVVDDVELRADQLTALASAVGERSAIKDAPARLLLLSRSNGEWLKDLAGSALLRTINDAATIRLSANGIDHAGQFRVAHERFADRLGVLPTDLVSPDQPATLLETHAAALDGLLSTTPGQAAPLERAVRHDRRHLRRLVAAEGRADLDTGHLATICTVATLCRPASEEQAQAIRERLPDFLTGLDVDEYLTWAERIYPGPYSLNALRPDSLGEQVVAATLAARPSIAVTLAQACTDDQLVNALTVLGRAMSGHPELTDPVVAMVRVDPLRLVNLGMDVAVRLADAEPFVRALSVAVGDERLSEDQVFALFHRLSTAGPELNPLKAAMLRVYTNVFAKPLGDHVIVPAVTETPGLVPLQQIATRLTDFVQNAFEGFLDPGSGKLPKAPDGSDIVPPHLLEMLRRLTVDGKWFPRDDKR